MYQPQRIRKSLSYIATTITDRPTLRRQFRCTHNTSVGKFDERSFVSPYINRNAMRTFHGSGFSKILLRSPAVIHTHKDPGHFLQECGHKMRCGGCQLCSHGVDTRSSPSKAGAATNLFQLGDQVQRMVGIVWVVHDRPGGKANSVLGTLPYYPLRIRV